MIGLLDLGVARGQSFSVVQDKYQKGDLKGAESAAKKALTSKLTKQDKAKTLKILGLVQYTLGNKNAATLSFQQALQIDPDLGINSSEALDPSVITYFQSLKSKHKKTSPISPTTAPGSLAATKSSPKAGPVKKTLLKVISNISQAQVTVDGILAGTANELINVEPGKAEIQIQASGYPTRKAVVTIVKDAENAITLNLEKPKPKPAPVAAVSPKPSPPPRGGKGGGRPISGAKRPPKQDDDLFAPTPSDQNFTESGGFSGATKGGDDPAKAFEDEARMGTMPPQPGPARQGPGLPGPGGMVAAPTQPYGGQPTGVSPTPPPYQQGYPPQSYPPQSYPPQSYPPQSYPPQAYQQPMYIPAPAPIYMPPPVVYQAPSYSYPPPAALSQPVPPPQDPYTSGQAPQSLPPDPATKSESSRNKQGITFLSIMPFGIGQASQERYLVGGVFAGAGVAAAYFYIMAYYAIAEDVDNIEKSKKGDCSLQNTSGNVDAQNVCNTYFTNTKKTIKENENNQQMIMMGAGAVAIVSSLESILWEPPPKSSRSPKRKKSKSKKYRGFTVLQDSESYGLDNLSEKPYLNTRAVIRPTLSLDTSDSKQDFKLGAQLIIGVHF